MDRKNYAKEYYEKNKEKIRARVYAQRTTPEGRQKRADYAKRYMSDPVVRTSRMKYNREYIARPEVVNKYRRLNLKNYGLTLEEYSTLYEQQNGLCALCARPATDFKKALFVDHDHETGVVRGLLCPHCNFAEGNIRKTGVNALEFARRLVVYLSK